MSGKEEAHESTEEKPKKSKKKLVIIAVLGLVSLVGGAGVASMFMGKEPPPEEHAEELHEPHEEEKHIETADLGQFIVNLSDMGSFLKVRIMIEYDAGLLDKQLGVIATGAEGGKAHGGGASGGAKEAAAGGGLHPHLVKKEHQFRDVIIRILSSKKAPDILTVEGKTRLKEELMDGLNEAIGLEEPPVVGILFTDFMVQ